MQLCSINDCCVKTSEDTCNNSKDHRRMYKPTKPNTKTIYHWEARMVADPLWWCWYASVLVLGIFTFCLCSTQRTSFNAAWVLWPQVELDNTRGTSSQKYLWLHFRSTWKKSRSGAAAQRRQAALHLEERRRQERQAFDFAWKARRSSRVGRAFVELWSFVKIYLL